MKASKTGLVILMFVLMSIILMVAFGGKPCAPSPPSPGSTGLTDAIVLRQATDDLPTTSAKSAAHPLPLSAVDATQPLSAPLATTDPRPVDQQRSSPLPTTSPFPQSPQLDSKLPAIVVSPPPSTTKPRHPPTTAEIRYHRVIDGDTLSSIADAYWSSPERFLDIFAANRGILDRPDVLPLGARLVIPPPIAPQTSSASEPPASSESQDHETTAPGEDLSNSTSEPDTKSTLFPIPSST